MELMQLARTSDPITSHLAAQSVGQFSRIHHEQILDCLKRHGPQGKDAIARLTNMNGCADGNAVARRMKELERQGLVETTGHLVSSKSGRMERQWAYVIPKYLF